SLLDESKKIRDRLIRLGSGFILGVEARDERQIRCPLGDRFEWHAFKRRGGSHPEAVDRIRQQENLDAACAEPLQMGRSFEASDVVTREIVDRGLVLFERRDVIFQTTPCASRAGSLEAA